MNIKTLTNFFIQKLISKVYLTGQRFNHTYSKKNLNKGN
jgi:hypothetical protein